jgi:hypothetical protein
MKILRFLSAASATLALIFGFIFCFVSMRGEIPIVVESPLMYATILGLFVTVIGLILSIVAEMHQDNRMRNISAIFFITVLLIVTGVSLVYGFDGLKNGDTPRAIIDFSVLIVWSGVLRIIERSFSPFFPQEKKYKERM